MPLTKGIPFIFFEHNFRANEYNKIINKSYVTD
jgi:hypothetical protein